MALRSLGPLDPATRDRILDAVHLGEFLVKVEGLDLAEQSSGYRGPCPFEEGSSQNSDKFSARDRTYHCFGCGEGGDLFEWLMKTRRLEFAEAVAAAAAYAGVSITHLERNDRSPADRAAQVARPGFLAALVSVGEAHTATLAPEARQITGWNVEAMIAAGEVLRFPDREALDAALAATGYGHAERVAANISASDLDACAGQWVLVARQAGMTHARGDVVALRPVGAAGPLVGRNPNHEAAYVEPPPRKGKVKEKIAIVLDDELYLALRASGSDTIMRPLTPQTLTRRPHPFMKNLAQPPVLLASASSTDRSAAFDAAVALLQVNPRLRFHETPLPPTAAGARVAFVRRLAQQVVQAGTLLDWAIERLAISGALDTAPGRQRAAARLGRIVQAVEAPVDRLAYRLEVEALTGVPVPERPTVPTASPTAPTAPASPAGRAAGRAAGRRP